MARLAGLLRLVIVVAAISGGYLAYSAPSAPRSESQPGSAGPAMPAAPTPSASGKSVEAQIGAPTDPAVAQLAERRSLVLRASTEATEAESVRGVQAGAPPSPGSVSAAGNPPALREQAQTDRRYVGAGTGPAELAPGAPETGAPFPSQPSATPVEQVLGPAMTPAGPRPTAYLTPKVRAAASRIKPKPTSRPLPARTTGRLTGTASWYCDWNASPCTRGYGPNESVAAAGPLVRQALGNWRGRTVYVNGVAVTLVDWCGCPGGRVLDLYAGVFLQITPLSRGVVRVTVTW